MPTTPRLLPALAALLLATPHAAQPTKPAAPPDTAARWKGGPFDRLVFRNIGPTGPSGRIDDLAVFERDPRIFYVGTATGGVWKTTNGGTTLTPVFDSASVASVGAVAVSQDDPNLVWVGTGENNNRQSSSWGDGVHRSTDGGVTWKPMGLRESRQIARIVLDPRNPDVVYVAALGDLWRPGGERGVYKTTDGGTSWTRVLDGGPDAGATELVMDPRNPLVLYAALYQRRRASFGFNGGGPASGLHKTTDGGRTWTRLAGGLPEGPMGRIGLDVFRRNPNVVVARIEHEKAGGIYRSDDAGVTWRKMSGTNGRPMYFGIIRLDPENDLRVYLPQTPLGVSDDGGKTFRFDGASRVHVDFHALWVDPRDPSHLIIGGDGGVAISHDRARKWRWLPHLPVAQFYHVGYDMQQPYHVCGGLQDNNSWCAPSRVRHNEGIADHDWWALEGGDGFTNVIDPTDARTVYTSSQEGYFARMDRLTGEQKLIRPEAPASEPPLRWNWDTPFLISPHDPATLYIGAHRLFRSRDRGQSWTAISGDLTTGVQRDTLSLMGTKLKDVRLAQNDGVDQYASLFTVAESRRRSGILYTGSDDGQVHVTRDGGATWTNLTAKFPGIPRWAYVSRVEPSKFEDGTAYVTFDAHRVGDYGTYVFAVRDFGAAVTSIAGTLPKGEVARSITEDIRNPDVLYLGTETGVFVTLDRGKSWQRLRANLPTVPVYEITLHPRDNAMLLATHGRGIWILDDLAPIQEAAQALTAEARLFTVPTSEVRASAPSMRFYFFQGDQQYLGPNPPAGTPFRVWLGKAADSVRLRITDGAGRLVRDLGPKDLPDLKAPAVNVVQWNHRMAPIARPAWDAPAADDESRGGAERGTLGPIVLPGRYTATLMVNGRTVGTQAFEVAADRETRITDAERTARHDLLVKGQRYEAQLSDAVTAVRKVRTQLAGLKDLMQDTAQVPATLRATYDSLVTQATAFRTRFFVRIDGDTDADFADVAFGRVLPFKLDMVRSNVGGATVPPTATDLALWAEVERDVPQAIDDVNALLGRVGPFYVRLAEAGLQPRLPKAIGKP